MQANKRKKLEKYGWKTGTAGEFLGLSPDEAAYIEMKIGLSHSLRDKRLKKKLSQKELARLIKSSQHNACSRRPLYVEQQGVIMGSPFYPLITK
jgi:hypothetical protein